MVPTNLDSQGLVFWYNCKTQERFMRVNVILDAVARRLDQRPRKTLGFETLECRLTASVASTHRRFEPTMTTWLNTMRKQPNAQFDPIFLSNDNQGSWRMSFCPRCIPDRFRRRNPGQTRSGSRCEQYGRNDCRSTRGRESLCRI